MKRSALLRLGVLACALAGLLATGCGTKKVKVHGKLTYGAKPVTGSEREPLIVTFCPYNGEGKADGQPYPAEVDQSAGTYEVVVPVGQHRICVSRFRGDLNDQFEGTFAQGQSPILREVQDETEINLDLQKLHREANSGTVSMPMPR